MYLYHCHRGKCSDSSSQVNLTVLYFHAVRCPRWSKYIEFYIAYYRYLLFLSYSLYPVPLRLSVIFLQTKK